MICSSEALSNFMFPQFDPMLIRPQALSIPGPGQARANNGWALSTLVPSHTPYLLVSQNFVLKSRFFAEVWPSLPAHIVPDELGRGWRLLPDNVRPPCHWRLSWRAAPGPHLFCFPSSLEGTFFDQICKHFFDPLPWRMFHFKNVFLFPQFIAARQLAGAVWIGLHQSRPQTQFTWTWAEYYGFEYFSDKWFQEWLWLVGGVSLSRGRLGWICWGVWGEWHILIQLQFWLADGFENYLTRSIKSISLSHSRPRSDCESPIALLWWFCEIDGWNEYVEE